jgi:hypothetical protein
MKVKHAKRKHVINPIGGEVYPMLMGRVVISARHRPLFYLKSEETLGITLRTKE